MVVRFRAKNRASSISYAALLDSLARTVYACVMASIVMPGTSLAGSGNFADCCCCGTLALRSDLERESGRYEDPGAERLEADLSGW